MLSEEEIIRIVSNLINEVFTGKLINMTKMTESYETNRQAIQGLLDLYNKEHKNNKEWFDIADNILMATTKYGEISIGEVASYIDRLQKELDKKDKVINLVKNKLEQEIKHCESENAHLYDKCNIQLYFHKNLLNTIKQMEVEDE